MERTWTLCRSFTPSVALALWLSACSASSPLPGPTGRVGANFRVELDLMINKTPAHLVHVDRCREYIGPSGLADPSKGEKSYVAENGAFTASVGGRRIIVVAPHMCWTFNNVPPVPPEQQVVAAPKTLSMGYLPLIGALSDDGDGLRLYLSKEALSRDGMGLERIAAVIPAGAPGEANVQPVPMHPMLKGEVLGRCYRAWLLSPADPVWWRKSGRATEFARNTHVPSIVPDVVANTLDPNFRSPKAAAPQSDLYGLPNHITGGAFDALTEAYFIHGAESLATVREGDWAEDPHEWTLDTGNLASSLLGWGVPPGPTQGGARVAERKTLAPESFVPLERSGDVFQPGTSRQGVIEYLPESHSCGPDIATDIPVKLNGGSLWLRPFSIFYWPEMKNFFRIIPSLIRLP